MDRSGRRRWPSSQRAIRAVQMAFDTSRDLATAVRLEAVRRGLSASDVIREIVGLPVSGRPVRPRLTVSLTDDDFAVLARRYGIDAEDRLAIKRRVMEELLAFSEAGRRDGRR